MQSDNSKFTGTQAHITVTPEALMYCNRLSDLLFNAARLAARADSDNEITWRRPGQR